MSLDKTIISGKEHHKPYRVTKAVDSWCRNHGKCLICRGNRMYKNNRRNEVAEQQISEYKAGNI